MSQLTFLNDPELEVLNGGLRLYLQMPAESLFGQFFMYNDADGRIRLRRRMSMSRLEFDISLLKSDDIDGAYFKVPFDVLNVFGSKADNP